MGFNLGKTLGISKLPNINVGKTLGLSGLEKSLGINLSDLATQAALGSITGGLGGGFLGGIAKNALGGGKGGLNLGGLLGQAGNLGKTLGLSGPSASGFRGNQAASAQSLQAFLPQYQKLAQQGAGMYGLYNPQMNQAAGQYLNYLRTDPYAGGKNSAMYKMATQGIDDTFARQQSALQRRSAQTGIPVGSALQNLGVKRQAMLNTVNTQLAAQRQQDTERRLNSLFGVTSGLAQQGLAQQYQGLGAGQNLLSGMYGMYGDLANAEEQRKAAGQANLLKSIGLLGNLYGGLAGGGAFGAVKK